MHFCLLFGAYMFTHSLIFICKFDLNWYIHLRLNRFNMKSSTLLFMMDDAMVGISNYLCSIYDFNVLFWETAANHDMSVPFKRSEYLKLIKMTWVILLQPFLLQFACFFRFIMYILVCVINENKFLTFYALTDQTSVTGNFRLCKTCQFYIQGAAKWMEISARLFS